MAAGMMVIVFEDLLLVGTMLLPTSFLFCLASLKKEKSGHI